MDNLFGITPEPGVPALEGEQKQDPGQTREGSEPGGAHTPDSEGSTPSPAPTPSPDPAPEPERPEPTDAEAEAAAFEAAEGEEGIRLGNKVYKDWAAADHVFRTFAGKASAEAKKRRELEQRLEALERERADAFSRPAPSASADETAVPAPAGEAEPRPAPRKRLKEVLTRDEVNRMIVDDGIDAVIERLSDLVEERIEQTADEKFAPLKPIADRKAGVEMAVQAFDAAANRTTKDGSYVFPELDPAQPSSDAIVQIWQRRVFEDEEFRARAFEPLAIEACVLEYRSAASTSTAPTAEPTRPASRPDAAALQGMGRQASPSPAAAGPTRRVYLDPEETTRRIFASQSDNPFGVVQESPRR